MSVPPISSKIRIERMGEVDRTIYHLDSSSSSSSSPSPLPSPSYSPLSAAASSPYLPDTLSLGRPILVVDETQKQGQGHGQERIQNQKQEGEGGEKRWDPSSSLCSPALEGDPILHSMGAGIDIVPVRKPSGNEGQQQPSFDIRIDPHDLSLQASHVEVLPVEDGDKNEEEERRAMEVDDRDARTGMWERAPDVPRRGNDEEEEEGRREKENVEEMSRLHAVSLATFASGRESLEASSTMGEVEGEESTREKRARSDLGAEKARKTKDVRGVETFRENRRVVSSSSRHRRSRVLRKRRRSPQEPFENRSGRKTSHLDGERSVERLDSSIAPSDDDERSLVHPEVECFSSFEDEDTLSTDPMISTPVYVLHHDDTPLSTSSRLSIRLGRGLNGDSNLVNRLNLAMESIPRTLASSTRFFPDQYIPLPSGMSIFGLDSVVSQSSDESSGSGFSSDRVYWCEQARIFLLALMFRRRIVNRVAAIDNEFFVSCDNNIIDLTLKELERFVPTICHCGNLVYKSIAQSLRINSSVDFSNRDYSNEWFPTLVVPLYLDMLRKIDAPDVLKCRAIDVVLEMKKRSRRTIFSFSSPYTRICLILGLRGSIESTEGIDVETEQACLFQPSQDALTTLCEYICLFPDVAFEWLEVFRFQELDPTVLLRICDGNKLDLLDIPTPCISSLWDVFFYVLRAFYEIRKKDAKKNVSRTSKAMQRDVYSHFSNPSFADGKLVGYFGLNRQYIVQPLIALITYYVSFMNNELPKDPMSFSFSSSTEKDIHDLVGLSVWNFCPDSIKEIRFVFDRRMCEENIISAPGLENISVSEDSLNILDSGDALLVHRIHELSAATSRLPPQPRPYAATRTKPKKNRLKLPTVLHISKKKRRGRPSSSHAHTDDSYFPEHEVDSSPPRYSSPYLSPSSTSSGSPSVHPDSAQLSEASCLMQPAKSDSFQPESPLSSISTSEKQQEEVMDSLRSPAQTNSSVLPTSSQQYMSSTPSLSSLYGILDGRNAPRAMIHFPCWRDPKSNSIFSFLLGGRLQFDNNVLAIEGNSDKSKIKRALRILSGENNVYLFEDELYRLRPEHPLNPDSVIVVSSSNLNETLKMMHSCKNVTEWIKISNRLLSGIHPSEIRPLPSVHTSRTLSYEVFQEVLSNSNCFLLLMASVTVIEPLNLHPASIVLFPDSTLIPESVFQRRVTSDSSLPWNSSAVGTPLNWKDPNLEVHDFLRPPVLDLDMSLSIDEFLRMLVPELSELHRNKIVKDLQENVGVYCLRTLLELPVFINAISYFHLPLGIVKKMHGLRESLQSFMDG